MIIKDLVKELIATTHWGDVWVGFLLAGLLLATIKLII